MRSEWVRDTLRGAVRARSASHRSSRLDQRVDVERHRIGVADHERAPLVAFDLELRERGAVGAEGARPTVHRDRWAPVEGRDPVDPGRPRLGEPAQLERVPHHHVVVEAAHEPHECGRAAVVRDQPVPHLDATGEPDAEARPRGRARRFSVAAGVGGLQPARRAAARVEQRPADRRRVEARAAPPRHLGVRTEQRRRTPVRQEPEVLERR